MSKACSSIGPTMLLEYQRKHALKMLSSRVQEIGEFPLSNRTLGYRAYGAGYPVLFFPGNSNSRFFEPAWEKTESIASKLGIRVLSIDRPGVGVSSLPPAKTYSAFAEIIQELITAIQVKNIGIIGFSSGGPYALACACHLKSLVSCLVLVAADGEYASPTIGISIPEIYKGLTRQDIEARNDEISVTLSNQLLEQYESMSNETRKNMAKKDFQESILQGYAGIGNDRILETQPWDFKVLPSFPFPVHIYHGTDDESVSPKVAEWYSNLLQPSILHMLPKENHSLIRRHWETILSHINESRSPL